MQTLTITINDVKALKLLEDLESLQLIHVLKKNESNSKKLSERLYGSLSEEETTQLHKELNQMRSEWHRDI